ncbi:MAG TPA: hypothetical protein VHW24_14445 [Bryobacteraceae bacterium]|nr:hypothetical protein [Bryobacteraceae bacterium]
MLPDQSHLSDERLLMELDGELSGKEQSEARAHLAACWQCRARRMEMERAIADFTSAHRSVTDAQLPPATAPRARLRAQLSSVTPTRRPFVSRLRLARAAAAITVAALFAFFLVSRARIPAAKAAVISSPDARLTPGAATLANVQAVCSEANVKNKSVPPAMRQAVFAEYGLMRVEPRAYEVDYLVTPALGGADDLRNLWPHSYSAVWNARVKDALEDRLRDMVCGGRLDLAEAQREIAVDWIGAYKRYFHTEQPIDGR